MPPATEPLELLVLASGKVSVHPLPSAGRVTIGRSEDNDLRLNDASVSRKHAVLHVGAELKVEDLGSANGTRLRDPRKPGPITKTAEVLENALTPNQPVAVGPGDSIAVGSVLLTVRKRAEAPKVDGSRAATVVVEDRAMIALHDMADRVAQGQISVLILGETGVGKEILAETIHRRSPRSSGPFLRLNCAALSESLLESELFGHEKGAFTGAVAAKPGLLETAEGGTVFLDEVGELPMNIQVKLLRVLEERVVTRVGSLKPKPIDVRFVSATNRDLELEIGKGTFRQDLFFRLNGISITVPPLRERKAEIEPLTRTFVARSAAQLGRGEPRVTPEATRVLEAHPWPGNIRELRNVIERAVVLSGGDDITPSHLLLDKPRAAPAPVVAPVAAPEPARPEQPSGLKDELKDLERQRIIDALEKCAGNQTQAAALLGMSRRTLVSRLTEYNVPRPRKKP